MGDWPLLAFEVFLQSSSDDRVEFTEQVLCAVSLFITSCRTCDGSPPTHHPAHEVPAVHEVTPPRDSADRVDSIISPTSAPVPAAAGPCPSEYLLVCTASSLHLNHGSWHFSLESVDGQSVLEAGDEEGGDLNRLTLLAAVRGLESIDGPSGVTLLSHNRYLIRSLSDSLPSLASKRFFVGTLRQPYRCPATVTCGVVSTGRSPSTASKPAWFHRDWSAQAWCHRCWIVPLHRGRKLHGVSKLHRSPKRRTHRSGESNGAHPTPKDNLRRWLLASATSNATRGGRSSIHGRRFGRVRLRFA